MSNDKNDKLTMKFQPRTLQHLGLKMYAQIPAAIAELIANAYDADATEVQVKLYDSGDNKKIVVEDNGIGMTFDELNVKFLQIGRNRREEGGRTKLDRFPSGKKGLGKLALFGLGNTISIQTKSKNSDPQSFSMNWQEIKDEAGEYHPKLTDDELGKEQGTRITVSELKRKSPFNRDDIANGVAKLFNYFDGNFIVSISVNDKKSILLTNQSKFDDLEIEFEWKDDDFAICLVEYENKDKILGKVVTTKKPIKPGLRGISLFANGRLVNLPEFFGSSESSHFYSYCTGILNIDFIDEGHGENDLIATNRQSLDWEQPSTLELRKYLQNLLSSIQKDWRQRRKDKDKPHPNFDQKKWLSTLPKDKANIIDKFFNEKMEDNATASRKNITEVLHEIAPDRAAFHWRYLHKKLTDNAGLEAEYGHGHYFKACDEAIKIYIQECRDITSLYEKPEKVLITECFAVLKKSSETIPEIFLVKKEDSNINAFKNIQTGYENLSYGILAAFRNVLAHNTQEIIDGFISSNDCLDILSLISHLLGRLERRDSPQP